MKKVIKTSIFIFFGIFCFGQKNNIELGVSKTARWHFFTSNFSHEFQNNFELQIGLGCNISQLFNDNYYDSRIFVRPLEEKFSERFALNYGVKKYFQIKNYSTRYYISYNQNIFRSKLVSKNYYVFEGATYYLIEISAPKITFQQNLNLGLQTKLSEKVDFNINLGINHIFNEFISDAIKMRFEIGLVHSFKKENIKTIE